MLLIVGREERGAVGTDGDEVQPIPRFRAFGCRQRLITRRADRGGRQARHGVGVPRRLGRAVLVGGGHFLASQRVVDGGVELQPVVIAGQPVVNDAGDLGEVNGLSFFLHQRAHDQYLVGRHVERRGRFQ